MAAYWSGDYDFDVAGGVLKGYLVCDPDTKECPDPVVVGFDKCITHLKKMVWLGNGPILTAEAPFEHWEGRRTHTKDSFSFAELWGKGTIRVD